MTLSALPDRPSEIFEAESNLLRFVDDADVLLSVVSILFLLESMDVVVDNDVDDDDDNSIFCGCNAAVRFARSIGYILSTIACIFLS